jgi:MFS family permease
MGMKPTEQKIKPDAYAALRVREFRLFLLYRFFTTIAIQMQGLIVGWQVYELTKDPLALGLVGLAEALPNIAVVLFAGHAADRYNRKRIIVTFTLFFLAGTAALFIFTVKRLGILEALGVVPIYIVVAMSGIARAFLYPSIIAMMAQIIPREYYANASTWSSTMWHIGAITGPALGGLIYGFLGVRAAYISVGVFVMLSLAFFSFVRGRQFIAKNIHETLFQRLASGLRFVFKNQILLGSMSLDMFAVLFGGAIAMLPVFAAEILMVGPQGLGFLRAAPMLGSVLMSVVLAHRPPLVNAGRSLMLGIAGFGLTIICFALSRDFYLSMFLLFLSGAFDNISVIVRATAMQLITPDEMRGRVASVNAIFIGSSNEIGSFESGLAAKLMGLIPSVVFGGAMTLFIVGLTAKFAPRLRKLNLKELG